MVFNKYNKRPKDNNSRLNLIMAIIFLLAGASLFRLYDLQVSKYDLYVALASDQHQTYNMLQPSRGEIYIRDSIGEKAGEPYPLATNKDFAMIYAIPKEVGLPADTSERLYEILDEESVAREVDKILATDEFFSSTSTNSGGMTAAEAKDREKFRIIKRELEIDIRKKAIIESYTQKLSKKNDPYEPIKSKIDKDFIEPYREELNAAGIYYVMESQRFYPEGNIGAQLLGFVGYAENERAGRYGLEEFFNEELSGRVGSVRTERSANGSLIIINDRELNRPKDGSDLILTINRSIQFDACRKLNEAASVHGADLGTVIVMEPSTGAILAMCSYPDYDPNNYGAAEEVGVYNNPAVFDQYEPGSIFKVFTMAAGIDHGDVTPETTYNDKGSVMISGWPKPIKNSDFDTFGGHGIVNMVSVLELSLNTGAIFVMQKTGAEIFAEYTQKFGFGQKTGIELPGEGSGNIRSLERSPIRPIEAATATFGQGITVTPLQMITAYAAIVNGGILVKPYVVDEIVADDGQKIKTRPQQIRRVISERTALLLSGMMVEVVEAGHAAKAAVSGYYVGGKTGTAQMVTAGESGYSGDRTIHTFVGFAPADDPKFVMLVKLNDPKDIQFSASSCAPLFSEIAEFILNYFQIPKNR